MSHENWDLIRMEEDALKLLGWTDLRRNLRGSLFGGKSPTSSDFEYGGLPQILKSVDDVLPLMVKYKMGLDYDDLPDAESIPWGAVGNKYLADHLLRVGRSYNWPHPALAVVACALDCEGMWRDGDKYLYELPSSS